MERMFEKDIDYQRRLSSSILNQIPTGKFNNIPEAHEKDDKK